MKERGVSYTTSPVGEMGRSSDAGVIQLGELLEAGVKVSISIDNTSSYNCDTFVACASCSRCTRIASARASR